MAGLAYELVAGTMATYLIGQSITQFSFALGFFLFSMGIGSYLSRFAQDNLLSVLIKVQVLLSLVGGYSAFLLFLAFAYTDTLYPFFILVALLLGTCVGFEIPILLRIIGKNSVLRIAVSEVFTFDYIGALFASILFPLILLPYLGIIRASLFFGLLNLFCGFIFYGFLKKRKTFLLSSLILSLFILIFGFIFSEKMIRFVEDKLYQDPIVYTKDTKYQRIIITKWQDDIRLFLDGNLQFSTRDEIRYHEVLVHVPILYIKEKPKKVLVIGGGDGLAIRELLKYPSIEEILLLELDPEMIHLFQKHPVLSNLNSKSLQSTKVKIINEDAFVWLKSNANKEIFDLIITDLPDPNSYSLGKLYTVTFYLNLFKHLSKDGIFITQSTSPSFAREAYWSIFETIQFSNTKFRNGVTIPLHNYIPSFGDWGYILSAREFDINKRSKLEIETKFLNEELISTFFAFSKDIEKIPNSPVNHIDNQVLVPLYNQSWKKWF